jgi:hypothetical protein
VYPCAEDIRIDVADNALLSLKTYEIVLAKIASSAEG